MSKNIILFGATGSIGNSVLKILNNINDEFCLKGITCDKNINSLIDISNRYKCDNLGVSNEDISNDKNEILEKKNTIYGIENFEREITDVKSVYEKYQKNKIEILKNEMTLLDFNLSRIYHYLDKTFKNSEILVNIVTDHGHSYLGHSNKLLSQETLSIPWLLRGGDVPQSEYNELTENVDIFKSLLNLCEINDQEVLNDGILPTILGGKGNREYTYAESIYPNSYYQVRILDDKFRFDFKTSNKLSSNGKLVNKKNDYKLRDKKTFNIVRNENILKNFKNISESKIDQWDIN